LDYIVVSGFVPFIKGEKATMSSNPHDVAPMVQTYKKLFLYISIITIIGIAIAVLHPPLWFIISVGLIFMASKSVIVYSSFKKLLVGRNLLILVFLLTIIFVSGLLLTGIFEDKSHIVGTEDISKQLMMDQPEEGGHGH
jgi:hypothetical protein